MNSKLMARLFGVVAMFIGTSGTLYQWYVALTDKVYWVKASFLFPVFIFLGLSVILYPTSKAENLAKFGCEQMPLKHYPLGQKVLLGVGVILGTLNLALLSGILNVIQLVR